MEKLLQKAGFHVVSAANGAEAQKLVAEIPNITIALIDHELPDTNGLELIRQLRVSNPDIMLVMATMHDHRELIDEAFQVGADMFIVKPNGFIELYRSLNLVDGQNKDMLTQRYIIDQYGPRRYKGPSLTQA
jgi:DNA-binding response OmpR family regulator